MTKVQEQDIRDYLRDKVEEIEHKDRKRYRSVVSVMVTFLVLALSVGVYEVRQSARDHLLIEQLEKQVRVSVDWVTWYRVNRTYEMELRAVQAFMDGNNIEFNKVMDEFRQFRWLLTEDKIEQQKRLNIIRGGSYSDIEKKSH